MSNPSTSASDDNGDLIDQAPIPEKKTVTKVYNLGPLRITRRKEVRTDKKPSLSEKVMKKMFTCNCADNTTVE